MKNSAERNRIFRVLFLVLLPSLLFLLEVSAEAAEKTSRSVYVDAAAPPKGTGGSPQKALRSVKDALNVARAGDTVLIASGVYDEALVLDHRRKGLRVEALPGSTVVIRGNEKNSRVLYDATDTQWKGISFQVASGDSKAILLENFRGRFEQCRFEPLPAAWPTKLIHVKGGFPSFHASTFSGPAGKGKAIALTSSSKAVFTYCLFQDFAGVLETAQAAQGTFGNCLFTRNGNILTRGENSTGKVEMANSVFYLNRMDEMVTGPEKAPPLMLSHCVYTPPLIQEETWIPIKYRLEDHRGVVAENSSAASPRFAKGRYDAMISLGLDDTQNVPLWSRLAALTEKYGYPVSISVSSFRTPPELWQELIRLSQKGFEICSHTCSHASLTVTHPIQAGFFHPGLQSASLTVDDAVFEGTVTHRYLRLTVDGGIVFELNLDLPIGNAQDAEGTVTMSELVDALNQVGCRAELVDMYYKNIPARYLAVEKNLDIGFENFEVPLALDRKAFLNYELAESRKAIEARIPGYECAVVTYPQGENSHEVRGMTARTYSYARGGWTSPFRSYETGFHPYEMWGGRLGQIFGNPGSLTEDELHARLLMLFDQIKDDGMAAALYSHTENEFTLPQWEVLLEALRDDGSLPVLTLFEMGERMRQKTLNGAVEGIASLGLRDVADGSDYHPRSDSPLLGKGKPVEATTDFEGTPVSPNMPVNIGLYQRTRDVSVQKRTDSAPNHSGVN